MKKLFLVLFIVTLFSTVAFGALPSLNLQVTRDPDNNLNTIQVFNADTGTRILDCQNATCSIKVHNGTKVKVVPSGTSPSTGFFQWGPSTGSAAACSNTNTTPCQFAVTQDSHVTAKFRRIFTFRVQLGNGNGIIKVNVAGQSFNCENRAPLSCSQGALEGTRYKLEALAKPGSQFQGWSAQTGNATVCTGAGANFVCEFVVKQDSSLVANFIPIP